jgi:hypothetical protein
VASLAAISLGVVLASGSAQAAWVAIAENGLPGHLSLRSDPYPAAFLDLSPGSVAQWQVEADLADPLAELAIRFERSGALVARPDGLQLQVRACASEWLDVPAAPTCPTAATVLPPTAASSSALGALGPVDASSPVFPLGELVHGAPRYLLVTMSIPDTPEARADESLMGLTAHLGLDFTAAGESADPPGSPRLAYTGVDALGTVLLALGTLGVGLLLRSRVRGRMRGRRSGATS